MIFRFVLALNQIGLINTSKTSGDTKDEQTPENPGTLTTSACGHSCKPVALNRVYLVRAACSGVPGTIVGLQAAAKSAERFLVLTSRLGAQSPVKLSSKNRGLKSKLQRHGHLTAAQVVQPMFGKRATRRYQDILEQDINVRLDF